MIGAGLIVIGIVFLLKNLGIMSDIAWDVIWPIILVVIGITMIFKKK